jgi:hypothetical protein
LTRQLIAEDFPTFDRPTIATSGRIGLRNCSTAPQLALNSAEYIFKAATIVLRLLKKIPEGKAILREKERLKKGGRLVYRGTI